MQVNFLKQDDAVMSALEIYLHRKPAAAKTAAQGVYRFSADEKESPFFAFFLNCFRATAPKMKIQSS